MKLRILLTVLLLAGASLINKMLGMAEPLITGPAAGLQFESSNVSYMASMSIQRTFHDFGIAWWVVLLAVAWIWYKPAKKALVGAAALAIALAMFVAVPAQAYWDATDVAEVYTVLPNESAFWIPDVGNNKATQVELNSEDYLNANKVALKRFQVPHAKVAGSTYAGWDKYAPTGRLILVNRAPFTHEWVDDAARGTSNKKEGIHCQSSEGLDITVGISVAASVSEENAAKFLYHFGVNPPQGNRNDPAVIFTSVYYGRSLNEVMAVFGRNLIGTATCNQIMARGLMEANKNAVAIMANVATAVKKDLANYGIDMDFIGWSDTFEFDPTVQQAINRAFIATQDKLVAEAMSPYVETLKGIAAAEAIRTMGAKVSKFPDTIVGLPTNGSDLLGALIGAGAATPKAVK